MMEPAFSRLSGARLSGFDAGERPIADDTDGQDFDPTWLMVVPCPRSTGICHQRDGFRGGDRRGRRRL
jgi:hypothetical protein